MDGARDGVSVTAGVGISVGAIVSVTGVGCAVTGTGAAVGAAVSPGVGAGVPPGVGAGVSGPAVGVAVPGSAVGAGVLSMRTGAAVGASTLTGLAVVGLSVDASKDG